MRTQQEIIQHLEDLINDLEGTKYIAFEEVHPHIEAIEKHFSEEYKGESIFIFTDSYGSHGFLCQAEEYQEAITEYIDLLEPANDQEREEWEDSIHAQFLSKLI